MLIRFEIWIWTTIWYLGAKRNFWNRYLIKKGIKGLSKGKKVIQIPDPSLAI